MNLLLKQLNLSKIANNQKVSTPKYDRENTDIGIVHLGPGAFHRAHQAVYTENAMNLSGGHWGICGVSLRSATARDILAEQDNLYTLAILDKKVSYQVIGAIKQVLVASEQSDDVLARMSAASTKLVTLTITEKGYCLASDGSLDLNHPDIKHDLEKPTTPISAIGFIVEALKQRKLNHIKAFNVLSCDNVSSNGDKLRRAVVDYAGQFDSKLQTWINNHVAFPNAMVDSITPKTESYTIEAVSKAMGLQDNWPIQREEFSQWVIDNKWQGERPDWEKVGVIFTDDVAGFEQAKLRLLNCLHSTLAYAGSLAGFETIFDVASDEEFYQFITKLAAEEIIGSFTPPKELDVKIYSNDIIQRFLNPNIRHLLAQIAFDGSQKVQMRILPIIADNLALGRPTQLLSLSLACWFEFICTALKAGKEIVDPMASNFATMPKLLSDNVLEVVEAFLNIDSIFGPALKNNHSLKAQLARSLTAIRLGDIKQISQMVKALS
ncbi:mannitol dehydrogenase family protein [Colwellia sp. MB02u-10]|uniref:mannitol dehydrogenase family protein n=1 Tax=Colwellia sp. MB02u-10 TaxID=2759828 RepID=UPI0015F6CEE9|nr:mannitol dehydrogenase family protein [Colwellia sp. MB02u-10]MBA6341536.1 mannitol dehydrogenase family protein [Colwellia sp. MB02u-10]